MIKRFTTRRHIMDTNNLGLGPLIRLWGIKSEQLPSGPLVKGGGGGGEGAEEATKDESESADGHTGNNRDGASSERDQGTSRSSSSTQEELTNLLGSLLKEAVPFIDSVSPRDRGEEKEKEKEETDSKRARRAAWKSKGSKSYGYDKKSSIKVDLFERDISAKELETAAAKSGRQATTKTTTTTKGETWICRRSIHEDKPEKGTASWEEFRECFKERHPETEALFTPSVVRMDKRVVWDCEGVPPQKIANDTYSNFTLCVLEARHRVGRPLKDRTFPILQMTCSALTPASATATATTAAAPTNKEKREFLIISVTIPDYFDFDFDSAFSFLRKEKGTSKTETDIGTTSDAAEKDTDTGTGTVIASYASVERIRQLSPSPELSSGEGDGTGKIEWLMALTSDAGGILPRWIQNLAVPGQIAKDVPLFLGWIGREREKTK